MGQQEQSAQARQIQFAPSVYEHAARLTSNNFGDVEKEVDRVLALAENRQNICIGTGRLPFEAVSGVVLKAREYVLPGNTRQKV